MKNYILILTIAFTVFFGTNKADAFLIDFENFTGGNQYGYDWTTSAVEAGVDYIPGMFQGELVAPDKASWQATPQLGITPFYPVPVAKSGVMYAVNGDSNGDFIAGNSLFIDFKKLTHVQSIALANAGREEGANGVQIFFYDVDGSLLPNTLPSVSFGQPGTLFQTYNFNNTARYLELRSSFGFSRRFAVDDISIAGPEPIIPEPSSMLLLGSGLVGAFLRRRRIS